MYNDLFSIREELHLKLYGRSLCLAKSANQCVRCGVFIEEFDSYIERNDYSITGLCGKCHIEILGEYK